MKILMYQVNNANRALTSLQQELKKQTVFSFIALLAAYATVILCGKALGDKVTNNHECYNISKK